MTQQTEGQRQTEVQERPRISLVVGLASGLTIYMIYFLVVYFLVEAGCRTGLYRRQLLGLNAINALVLISTVVAAVGAAVATGIAIRYWRASRHAPEGDSYSKFLSLAGIGLNAYNTILIVLTALSTTGLPLCDWI